jgi:hypothetical protein
MVSCGRSIKPGFAVLCLEQQRSNNSNMYFNWFLPDDIRPGSGEAFAYQMING